MGIPPRGLVEWSLDEYLRLRRQWEIRRPPVHSDNGRPSLWSPLGYHYGLNNPSLRKYTIREKELNLGAINNFIDRVGISQKASEDYHADFIKEVLKEMGMDIRTDMCDPFPVETLETFPLQSGLSHAHNAVLNDFLHIMLSLSIVSVFHKVWWIHTSMDHAFAKGCEKHELPSPCRPLWRQQKYKWNHSPLLDAKSLGKGSSDLQRSWKRHTLWRSSWLFCDNFGADLREPPFLKNTGGIASLGKENIDPWCGRFKTRPPIPWHSSHWEVGFMSSHHESEWACAVLTNEVWWKGCYMTSKVRSCNVMGFCPACWFTLGILSHVEMLL